MKRKKILTFFPSWIFIYYLCFLEFFVAVQNTRGALYGCVLCLFTSLLIVLVGFGALDQRNTPSM